MRLILPVLALLAAAAPAWAECYAWPLRDALAYDGDTALIAMPGLPAELARMEVRLAGIDAPEMHGHCPAEKEGAMRATLRLRRMLATAQAAGRPVLFCDPVWDKYGARVRARLMVDGEDAAATLLGEGLARPYNGGQREGWCESGK